MACVSLLLLVSCLIHAQARNVDGDTRIGQTLATSVAESLERMKVLQHDGRSEGDLFQQSLFDALVSKQEVLTSPELSKVVARANRLAENRIAPADTMCARKWAHPCPDGWQIVGGAACSAPSSYTGGCGNLQSFEAANVEEKVRFASACKAPWPCEGEDTCQNGRNYDGCPLGWESLEDGFCKQNNASSTKCATLFNFADMGVAEKQALGKDCGVKWICMESCEQDFRAQCPEGWSADQELCLAPVKYAGDCGYSVNTVGMDIVQKRSFASSCKVRFPCVGSTEKVQEAQVFNAPDGPDSFREKNREDLGANRHGLPAEWFEVPSGPVDSNGGIHF